MNKSPQKTSKLNGLIFAINGYFVNHFIRVYQAFDGDFELAIILGEIAHYNAFHLFPDKATRSRDTEEVHKSLRGCNAHSISLSSGIPRETVRRKIKKLIDIGYITYDGKKQLVVTALPSEKFSEFSKETLNIFLDFIDELKADRLI